MIYYIISKTTTNRSFWYYSTESTSEKKGPCLLSNCCPRSLTGFVQGSHRELAAPAGGGHASDRGVTAEHQGPDAHLLVPSAWPEAAHSGLAMRSSGAAHGGPVGGANRR
jgi:hypothetical protein